MGDRSPLSAGARYLPARLPCQPRAEQPNGAGPLGWPTGPLTGGQLLPQRPPPCKALSPLLCLSLWRPHGKAGLEPRAAQQAPRADAAPAGHPPARLLPRPCSLHLCSCCQVRKHCEWCRALICRHEKPSALLKGRTACCHSETGKRAASRKGLFPSGDTIG